MRSILSAIEKEYRRYKTLAEAASVQLSDQQLHTPHAGDGNTVAVLMTHLGGNLDSRFTEFLTTDGEKPWRRREEEFAPEEVTREDLLARWDRGWSILFDTLAGLSDHDLMRAVAVRGVTLTVSEALQRSLAHAAYHVGQIVLLARAHKGEEWTYLSIPPGGTEAYAERPSMEKALDYAGHLDRGRR